jgi:hypothetical protein
MEGDLNLKATEGLPQFAVNSRRHQYVGKWKNFLVKGLGPQWLFKCKFLTK